MGDVVRFPAKRSDRLPSLALWLECVARDCETLAISRPDQGVGLAGIAEIVGLMIDAEHVSRRSDGHREMPS